MNYEPTSCYFCGSFEMYQGAFIDKIEKFTVFVCVKCLKNELSLKEYGIPNEENQQEQE